MCKKEHIPAGGHMKIYNKIVLSLLFVIMSLTSVAAELSNHYIITFDCSIGSRYLYYESKDILKVLDKTLSDNQFDYGHDYISIVGYTMEYGSPSIDRYVRAYESGGKSIVWYKLGENNLSNLFPNWPVGQPIYYNYPCGSMQSLAKPYSVIETLNKDDSTALANRTFLYIITDEVVNGTDDNYRQEWINASTCVGANYSMFSNISSKVFKTLQAFNEEFKFIQIKLNKNGVELDKIPISEDGIYKIVPYEVVSVERPSVHAITDIPSPLPLKRVKGGFMLSIDSHSLSTKHIIKNINILDSNGISLGTADSGKLEVFLSSENVSVGDTISLALTVVLKDGLYDGVIISPTNARYSDGMVVSQVIKVQNEAQILGVLPLSDTFWWWFHDDIFSAVMIWDLIILLTLIFIVGYIFYRCFVRINTYRPSNDKIIIKKTE